MNEGNGNIGGALVAAGALGVVVITAIYATAGTEASAPLPADMPIEAAVAAALESIGRLRLAGTIGIVADILLIGGCALLALRSAETPPRRLLWSWLGLSTAMFIGVDSIAAAVIPPVAAATEGNVNAFVLAKSAYDLCFRLGVFTFGLAFVAAAAEHSLPAWLRTTSLTIGLGSIGVVALGLAGYTFPLLFGAAVGAAGILGVVFGYRETRA